MQPHQELLKSGHVTQTAWQQDTALKTDSLYFHLRNGEKDKSKILNVCYRQVRKCQALIPRKHMRVWSKFERQKLRKFASHCRVVNCAWDVMAQISELEEPNERREDINKYFNKTGNARINVILRRFRLTYVAVEKQ
jgi:hypothetical protein